MSSSRLRWLNLYHGRLVDADDWEELDDALHHWERQLYLAMFRDGTGIHHFPKLSQVAGELAVRVGAWQGVCDSRPVYRDVNVDVAIDTADSGTLTGPTEVTNPGESRWIVVTVEYADIEYDDYEDADGVTGYYREDHGVRYRVFMGASAGAPSLPTADLADAYTDYKSMAIFAYEREFGELDTDTITLSRLRPMQSHWIGNDLSRAIRDSAACLGSMGVAQCRRVFLSGLALDEDDARLPSITPAAAVNGGTVTLTGDHLFLFARGKLRVQDSTHTEWESEDLDVSSTYFMRAKLNDDQSLEIYMDKGTLPAALGDTYTYPAGLVGTPGAGTGGFPSTELDCLLGKVVTGGVGTIPTVTPYRQGDFSHTEEIAVMGGPAIHTLSFSLPTPHACDMEVILQHGTETSIAPDPPPVGTYVTYFVQQMSLVFYNFETIRVYGKGQFLDDLGGGDLGKPAAANGQFRPAMRVIVLPKRRPTP